MKGFVHSFESFSTLDGPGIRSVIFFQGCPLRCLYCHNADAIMFNAGKPYTPEELFNLVCRYKSYYKTSGGGITASGGEPACQAEFLKEFFKLCKAEGIHTALDTSGFVELEKAKLFLPYTDLVLLDIKHLDNDSCIALTGKENTKALRLLDYLKELNKAVILRQVVVPGFTDSIDYISSLGRFARGFKNISKVELLPFHKMGEDKWRTLNLTPPLEDVDAFPVDKIKILNEILTSSYL